MTPPTLSIVAPVYNEAPILAELIARCTRAAAQRSLPFELLIVDDASTDDTPRLLAESARDQRVRSCRLPTNAGQFRATQAGLRAARGRWVLVLDGDLQDPPEYIPQLIDAATAAASSVVAVLAVKSRRDDPLAVMLGQSLFHRLQSALSPVPVPRGAGSYCVMRRAVADRVALAELRSANLAAVVAVAASAGGGTLSTVFYEKGPRYDGSGRVGWAGLVAEAVGSLAVTGALSRLFGLLAITLLVSAALASPYLLARLALFGAAGVTVAAALIIDLRTRRALAAVRAAHGSDASKARDRVRG